MTIRMKYACFALSLPVLVCAMTQADAQSPDWQSSKTLTVGTSQSGCPNAQYTTIAAAVTAAAPGDVIEICPALYPEQLVISKPLTLRGIEVNGVKRVLLQPTLADIQGLPT